MIPKMLLIASASNKPSERAEFCVLVHLPSLTKLGQAAAVPSCVCCCCCCCSILADSEDLAPLLLLESFGALLNATATAGVCLLSFQRIAMRCFASHGLRAHITMQTPQQNSYLQVYTVSVSPFFGVQAPGPADTLQGDVGINFSCSPANTHHLIDAAVNEVKRLQVRPL